MPFPSLSDGKGFAGWFKSFLFEKAICDKRHIIIKKLCHRVNHIYIQYVIALNQQRDDGIPVPIELEREIDPELASVIQARKEIPEHLEPQVYETISYGPYPCFRWREGKGPIYAISLADTSVEVPERFNMGGFFAIRRRKRST